MSQPENKRRAKFILRNWRFRRMTFENLVLILGTLALLDYLVICWSKGYFISPWELITFGSYK